MVIPLHATPAGSYPALHFRSGQKKSGGIVLPFNVARFAKGNAAFMANMDASTMHIMCRVDLSAVLVIVNPVDV